ncbi:MAG: cation:proton antiporter [Armatimonadetes bacterium]|nr:MAG: cation:proton antiporter [Armatimonadota bacterium]MCE7900090.1 cation:proton antiporter [Armatimonadetes bacterium ATM1]MDL1929393.1 cation:proton antiporter [Fimbriimonadia bacterium ATM]MBC6968961.1 cation:proton antiporter [Armatimonadota bacterium]MBL1148976.1 cation:proton antiporter [Armatimonadota bacterium]
MSNQELTIHFFLQFTVIVIVCRLVGWAARRMGQAQVVGEMIAGVLLGPSLFGAVLPEWSEYLFPRNLPASAGSEGWVAHPSMSILFVVSQLGLALYMFVVGLEFNVSLLLERGKAALWVSSAGILFPFVLGVAVTPVLLGTPGVFFPKDISFGTGALYVGAAMSITAFPMLARILYEHKIAATRTGTLTLAAGAMNDALAWGLLAVVLAASQNDYRVAVIALVGGAVFVAGSFGLARPILALLEERTRRLNELRHSTLAAALAYMLLACWITELIGLYAVFGAFLAGACMPRGRVANELKARIETLCSVMLLPLFFTFSGLNTQIGLLNTPYLALIAVLLCALAILGKGLGCALAARMSGESWQSSATIGTLMNARGLMELIILNIGLQQGIITGELFTTLVLMALFTTLMTSPLFRAFNRSGQEVA